MKAERGIYGCGKYQSQQRNRRGQRIDTSQSQEVKSRLRTRPAAHSFFLAGEFDGFHSLSLFVESKVSLR